MAAKIVARDSRGRWRLAGYDARWGAIIAEDAAIFESCKMAEDEANLQNAALRESEV